MRFHVTNAELPRDGDYDVRPGEDARTHFFETPIDFDRPASGCCFRDGRQQAATAPFSPRSRHSSISRYILEYDEYSRYFYDKSVVARPLLFDDCFLFSYYTINFITARRLFIITTPDVGRS